MKLVRKVIYYLVAFIGIGNPHTLTATTTDHMLHLASEKVAASITQNKNPAYKSEQVAESPIKDFSKSNKPLYGLVKQTLQGSYKTKRNTDFGIRDVYIFDWDNKEHVKALQKAISDDIESKLKTSDKMEDIFNNQAKRQRFFIFIYDVFGKKNLTQALDQLSEEAPKELKEYKQSLYNKITLNNLQNPTFIKQHPYYVKGITQKKGKLKKKKRRSSKVDWSKVAQQEIDKIKESFEKDMESISDVSNNTMVKCFIEDITRGKTLGEVLDKMYDFPDTSYNDNSFMVGLLSFLFVGTCIFMTQKQEKQSSKKRKKKKVTTKKKKKAKKIKKPTEKEIENQKSNEITEK